MAVSGIAAAPKPPVIIVTSPYAPAGPIIAGTSPTPNDVSLAGSHTFTMDQSLLGFLPGIRVRASYVGNASNWMEGIVTAFDGQDLTILVDLEHGAGVYSDWQINVAGERGQTGPIGLTGPVGPQGIVSNVSPAFDGKPTAPTASNATNDNQIATCQFVWNNIGNYQPKDGDLTALSGLPGVGVIYYRAATDVWAPVVIGTNLTFNTATGRLDALSTIPPGVAPLDSPAFIGTPTAPVVSPLTDRSGKIAVTQFVQDVVAVGNAGTVSTIKGAVTTANDDLGKVETNLNLKANIDSPVLSGSPKGPTVATTDSSTALATTAFVHSCIVATPGGGNVSSVGTPVANQVAFWTSLNTIEGRTVTIGNVSSFGTPIAGQLAFWHDATSVEARDVASMGLAPLASPALTGTPTAPTVTPATDASTKLATMAAVQAAISAALAAAPIAFTTGDVKFTLKTVADPTWIMMNDGTIGDVGAGATYENANAQALFTLLWNNVNNTNAPVTPGGRGASAAADWAAKKKIQLLFVLGRALAAAGTGSGLTARLLGSTGGAETVAPTLLSHSHSYSDSGHTHAFQGYQGLVSGSYVTVDAGGSYNVCIWAGAIPNTSNASTGIGVNANGNSAAMSIVQPSTYLNVMIKL